MAGGVKMIANKDKKLLVLTALPADPNNPKVSELAEGTAGNAEDISCKVALAGFDLGTSGVTTVNDAALCEDPEVQIPVSRTYTVTFSLFRYYDSGQPDAQGEDFFFQATKNLGDTVYLALRDGGKKIEAPAAASDEFSIYEVVAGGWGRVVDSTTGGYSKRVFHGTVRRAWEDVTVVAN